MVCRKMIIGYFGGCNLKYVDKDGIMRDLSIFYLYNDKEVKNDR